MNARDVRRMQTEKAQHITPTRDYLSPTSLNMLAYLHVSNTSVISTPFVGHVTHNHCGVRYDLVTLRRFACLQSCEGLRKGDAVYAFVPATEMKTPALMQQHVMEVSVFIIHISQHLQSNIYHLTAHAQKTHST